MLTVSIATFFGATRSEMISANESVDDAVVLAERDGFLASLGVHHEMHCLVRSFNPLSMKRNARGAVLTNSETLKILLIQGDILPQHYRCRRRIPAKSPR